jgi:hypothetical protein
LRPSGVVFWNGPKMVVEARSPAPKLCPPRKLRSAAVGVAKCCSVEAFVCCRS